MSFWGELKRRSVVKVAIGYLVVGSGLIQATSVFVPALNLPSWVTTFVVFILIVGFPMALVLSWGYDLSPQGLKRTPQLPPNPGITETAPSQEGPPTKASRSRLQPSQPLASRDPLPPASRRSLPSQRPETLRNSVAVLPLENLSPNPTDAYFAAGIHEEILNYLTKIKNLNVIARTSVKKYLNTDKPIAEIAQELGVATVMEGTVRYAGDRVRVTAQLIDGATEKHLWAEVYERSLADVFSIQADIAEKIAGALEAEFSAAERISIEAMPTTASSEAHALFLKAQALFAQDDTAIAVTAPPRVRADIQFHLDRALKLDPDFALLYAMKALVLSVAKIYDPIDRTQWVKRCAELDESVRFNAEKALSLNANIGIPHFALALNHQFNWRAQRASAAYDRALVLKPNDSNILGWYSMFRWFSNDFDEAVRLGRSAVALDPANPYPLSFLAIALHSAGDHQGAVDAYDRASGLRPGSPLPYLHRGMPEIRLGDEARALEGLKLADQLLPDAAPPQLHMHLAYGFSRVGRHEDARRVVERVKARTTGRFVDPVVWVWGHLALGQPAQALRQLKETVEQTQFRQEIFVRTFIRQNSWSDPVLEEPDFVDARMGLAL
jgi:TolB-like protein